jgi:hypothetical protein
MSRAERSAIVAISQPRNQLSSEDLSLSLSREEQFDLRRLDVGVGVGRSGLDRNPPGQWASRGSRRSFGQELRVLEGLNVLLYFLGLNVLFVLGMVINV